MAARERNQATQELGELIAEIRLLTQAITETPPAQTQTVLHKSDGSAMMVGLCIACVFIMIGYIIIENRSFGTVTRQIDAMQVKIAKLEAAQQAAK